MLVTGAGGSIGSELCRQIARVRPSRLILVDNAEGPLFEIERELVAERDFTAALPKLIDVKDRKAMRREVFEKYQPTVVFHAAAYKHVAMLETHPLESVRNNVVGHARSWSSSRPSSASSGSSSSRPTRPSTRRP